MAASRSKKSCGSNFSPKAATREIEDYAVALLAVTVLELSITPDISGRHAFASLERLRLA
jgi:hypothetical protein